MAKRSKSSQRWLERQRRDPYVKAAAKQQLGSRAHFKLEQLNRRFRLLRPGMHILELGAAPGGWTRYMVEQAPGCRIIAVDYREMSVPPGVTFLQLDIHSTEFLTAVDTLVENGLDLVLSDMAPNISGIKVADQAAAMGLAELATDAAGRWLKPGGHLVVKMFQGEGVDGWLREQRQAFERVVLAKPDASRQGSREVYGVALGYRGGGNLENL